MEYHNISIFDKKGVVNEISVPQFHSMDDTLRVLSLDDEELEYSDPETEDDEQCDDENQTEEIIMPRINLRKSLFPNRPSCIIFRYAQKFRNNTRLHIGTNNEDIYREDTLPTTTPLKSESVKAFFICHWERNCVKNAFFDAGVERDKRGYRWTAAWIKHLGKTKYKNLKPHQKINHFPDSWVIGRKDRLMSCLTSMRRQFGSTSFSFLPEGFSLPDQKEAFLRAVQHDTKCLWILKPPASSCGRGIRVITTSNVESIPKQKKRIIQRYIANPCLIDKKKFDIRVRSIVDYSIYS